MSDIKDSNLEVAEKSITDYNFKDDKYNYKRKHFFSNSGNKNINVYELKKDRSGRDIVVITGTKSLYDMIQSEKDDSNIDILYQRYKNGDIQVKRNALNLPGQITDFRKLPTDLISTANFMSNIKDTFYTLPLELRSVFNNNYSEFAVAVKNGSATQKVQDFIKNTYNLSPATKDSVGSDKSDNENKKE